MSDTSILDLPTLQASLDGSELITVTEAGTTYQMTLDNYIESMGVPESEALGNVQVAGPPDWGGAAELFAYCDNWMNLYVNGVLKHSGLNWGGGQAGYFLQGITMVPGDVVAMKCNDYGGTSNAYLNYISTFGWQWGTDATWKMASSVPGGTHARVTDSNTDWASPLYDDSSWSAATDLGMSGFAIATNFPSYTKHGRFIWDTSATNLHITRWFRGVVVAHYP